MFGTSLANGNSIFIFGYFLTQLNSITTNKGQFQKHDSMMNKTSVFGSPPDED